MSARRLNPEGMDTRRCANKDAGPGTGGLDWIQPPISPKAVSIYFKVRRFIPLSVAAWANLKAQTK